MSIRDKSRTYLPKTIPTAVNITRNIPLISLVRNIFSSFLKPSEAPVSAFIKIKRLCKVIFSEIRPERIRKEKLGVSKLPYQVIRESSLSACSYHKIRVGYIRRIQITAYSLLRQFFYYCRNSFFFFIGLK